jgi:hypothetical protein
MQAEKTISSAIIHAVILLIIFPFIRLTALLAFVFQVENRKIRRDHACLMRNTAWLWRSAFSSQV